MDLLLLSHAMSANQNLENVHISINALLEQKCSISSQPTPKQQANSTLYPYFLVSSHPKQG